MGNSSFAEPLLVQLLAKLRLDLVAPSKQPFSGTIGA